MYQTKNMDIKEPWATIKRWCEPLKHTTWYNLFGMVVIVISDGSRPRYSVPLEEVETVVHWGREEFLVQLAWRRHRQEMPLPDELERHILLPGIGVLGVRLNAYLPQAATLDEAFTLLAHDARNVLLPGAWFIIYRRVPSPTALGWSMRKVSVVLYHSPDLWGIPAYSVKMTHIH